MEILGGQGRAVCSQPDVGGVIPPAARYVSVSGMLLNVFLVPSEFIRQETCVKAIPKQPKLLHEAVREAWSNLIPSKPRSLWEYL